MNFLDNARLSLARTLVKGADLGATAAQILGVNPFLAYNFVRPTFRQIVHEGHRANSAVFACVSTLAFAFVEPRLRVYLDDASGGHTPVPQHGLSKLIARPTEGMSTTDLLQMTMIYLALGGNAYWLKLRGSHQRVSELCPLNDAQMVAIPGGNKIVSHYELIESTGRTRVEKKDVVHFRWLWDPLEPWRGTAPIIAAAREVDTENEATRYVYTVLKNDAVPRLAVIAPVESDWSDPDKRKRLRESWLEMQGGDNRGLPAFLWNGARLERVGLNLEELAFESLRRVPEARIAAVLRVPPVVAGLGVGLDSATYNNTEQAARWMTERTLIPLWRMVEEKITSDLIPEFDDPTTPPEVSVGFDLNTVVALGERITEKRAWATDAWQKGLITQNEGRAALGMPQDKNGDVYLASDGTRLPAQFASPTASKAFAHSSARTYAPTLPPE